MKSLKPFKMKKIAQKLTAVLILTTMGVGFAFSDPVRENPGSIDRNTTEQATNNPERPTVKIALLLDTSNSMDGLINQAKSQLWDIVNQFTYAKCGNDVRPGLKIALYQYGNNDLSSEEGYIQQVLGFSSDLDEISAKLFSLTTHGGEEYCGQVIDQSVKQLAWGKNPDDLKMIFIAGNEPFTQGRKNFRDAVLQARENDVIINTIFCGGYSLGVNTQWQEGARLGGGEYMAIDHNRQVVHVRTPYDEIIIKLNQRLNSTYVSYGAKGAERMAVQAEQDEEARSVQEAVAVKRAVSKSSAYYDNAVWDLVDASSRKDFDLSEIKRETLPESLRERSEEEISTFLEDKRKERKSIQSEIQQANTKRQAYLTELQKNETGELEQAILEAIKKQASRKKLYWE
jgi:hypothetical protein